MFKKIVNYIKQLGVINLILLFGYLTNPLNYGYLIGYFLIIKIILYKDFVRNHLDLGFLLLFFFSITYGLIYSLDPIAGDQYIFIYMFTPPFLYLWGKYLIYKTTNPDQLIYIFLCIGAIFSLPALISVLLNIREGGFAQPNRNIPLFWSSHVINATGMAIMFVFNMCIPSILLAGFKKFNLITKVCLTILFILSLLCVLRLGSRTQLVVILFTFLTTLFYVFPKQTLKQNIIMLTILLLFGLFVFRNVSFDLNQDWLTSFAGRMENNGGEDIASGGGRTQRWSKSLQNIIHKPLGWNIGEFGYSHNLWLDVARAGGVLSFLLLLIYCIRSFINVKKAIASNPNNIPLNITILSYVVAFFLQFMVEPILDGSFLFFVIFCLCIGAINQYKTNHIGSVQV